MIKSLLDLLRFSAPPQPDPEKNFRAWMLTYILRSLTFFLLVLILLWVISTDEPFSPLTILTDLVFVLLVGVMLYLIWRAQRGHVTWPGIILVGSIWLGMAVIAWEADGVRDLAIIGQLIAIFIGGLILGWQSALVLAVCSIGFIYVLTMYQLSGVLLPSQQPLEGYARDLGSMLILATIITILINRSIKKVFVELRRSEERFRNAFENAPIGMAIVGLDEKILQVNQALCTILGYSRERLTATTILSLTHPDDRQKETDQKQNMLDGGGQTFSMVKRYLHADGHIVWGKLGVSLVFDEEHKPLYYLGQMEDITEQERTEDELRRTYDLLHTIVQVSPLAIDIVDPEHKIRLWSPASERLFGWKGQEILGKDISTILGDRSAEVKSQIEEELHGGVRSAVDTQRYRKDGSAVDVSLWAAPLQDKEGRYEGVVSFLADITERRQIQKELEENRRRLEFLLAHSPTVIYSSRATGDFGATFVSANVMRQMGFQPEDFTSDPSFWLEHIHPEDRDRVVKNLKHLFQTGFHTHEYRFQHSDGHYLWMRDELALIRDETGEPIEIIGSWIDLTEHKQSEMERERLIADLKSKNDELERFTYTVSHDLKSPLVTISGFLGFLEEDARAGDLERLQKDSSRISEAVQKMQRLLNELLELSRIGRVKNISETVPFEALAHEAIALVRGPLDGRGVAVFVQPGLSNVCGDRPRLVEVLQNLLENAVKYIGEANPSPRVEIGQRAGENGKGVFYVKDNGIGISPAHHENVFGLFNKLDPKSVGTGVGLALVKRIVEVHGGRVWVESELGQGATFCFTLPLAME